MGHELRFYLDNLWRWKCDVPEMEPRNIYDAYKSEWSIEFEQMMRNRLAMGALHYGPMQKQDHKAADFNTDQIRRRLSRYLEDGDREHLVDIANFALCEFVREK